MTRPGDTPKPPAMTETEALADRIKNAPIYTAKDFQNWRKPKLFEVGKPNVFNDVPVFLVATEHREKIVAALRCFSRETANLESLAKATEGKTGMAVGTPHVRQNNRRVGLQVGEADAVQPATSEIMDVTAGETAPNSTSDQSGASAGPMTVAQIEQWILACNHEPARNVLRSYLRLTDAASRRGEPELTPEQIFIINDMIHAWVDDKKEFRQAFRNDCKRLLRTVLPADLSPPPDRPEPVGYISPAALELLTEANGFAGIVASPAFDTTIPLYSHPPRPEPTDATREGWISAADFLARAYPDNVNTNAFCAALRSHATPSPAQAETTYKVGRWLSAALDDPQVCAEMKADILAWMEAGKPNVQPPSPAPATAEPQGGEAVALREALEEARRVLKDECLPWLWHHGKREGTTHGEIDKTLAVIDAALAPVKPAPSDGGAL